MKLNRLLLIPFLATSVISYACGVHQSTGFNLVTEPGSLVVFENIIEMRQMEPLGDMAHSQKNQLRFFLKALNAPYKGKIHFSLFEATKGHYSQVSMSTPLVMAERTQHITEKDLLVISEWDVLAKLALKRISWEQAKERGLAKVNGPTNEIHTLDKWFNQMFPGPVTE